MKNSGNKNRPPMPFMKTFDDAMTLCEREHDNFYLTLFMFQVWLGELSIQTRDEYAEKKSAVQRRLQTGRALEIFDRYFGHTKAEEYFHIIHSLCRFSQYDDSQSDMAFQALSQFFCEESPPTPPSSRPTLEEVRTATTQARHFIVRFCDWLEAVAHRQTHAMYYWSPVSFDFDPAKRELAALGINQKIFAELSKNEKEWWFWRHGEAAERFKDSPKWPMIGQAMSSVKTRKQKYPQLDMAIISCWPLVKKHNWTYLDLCNVLNALLPKMDARPLQREHDMATYCNNVLGLRKETNDGVTAKNGKPAGFDLALRLSKGKSS